MYNFKAKFDKILDICKHFSKDLVNNLGNVPRRGVVPVFSDLEVIALSLLAESESIDSESRLFVLLKDCKSDFPNLISRRQYNDRRKFTINLCEKIRKRVADAIDGGENYFCIDSKPIEVCRISRAKRCKIGKDNYETAPSYGWCSSQRLFYYGYKLHALCGLNGVIHSTSNCYITTAASSGTEAISAKKSNLTCSRRQIYAWNVLIGITKRIINHFHAFSRNQGRGLKLYFPNLLTK